VILPTPVTRILAYREPIDMRRSFDGLFGVVTSVLSEDPLSPTLFVFFNRRRTLLKALWWDRTGFCLFAKRLERGRFVLAGDAPLQDLDERRFRLLLDGIVLGKCARMR
jgi:transposase